MEDSELESEVVAVSEMKGAVYVLRVDSQPGDSGGGQGHVWCFRDSREEGVAPDAVLDTNTTLRTLWASPQGRLWAASAHGSVGTTAKVAWPAPNNRVRYEAQGRYPKWTVTNLPPVRSTGIAPNVTALWGTADNDVFAGCYGGHIYHWNGSDWTQPIDGPGNAGGNINAFGGGPNDVYALGNEGTVIHHDGSAWRRLALPGAPNGHESFMGMAWNADGQVLIAGSGDEGRLLSGSAGNLSEFGRYAIELIGMARLGARILFATGDGVAELFGHDVTMIKSSFQTVSVFEGKDRVFFTEPSPPESGFIEYKPSADDLPWMRIEF